MKYQGFITERKDPSLQLKAEYRAYYLPVREHEGGWMPAGAAQEDAGYTQADMLSNVLTYQVSRPTPACGPLDDIASPDGHTVVARYWIEDDYSPPTPEEQQRQHEEAVQKLRDMGVWRDTNA
jgi:hypothetical protein